VAEVEGDKWPGGHLLFWRQSLVFIRMSRSVHREKYAHYQLQWEAMRLAQAHGVYNIRSVGAPDGFDEMIRCGASSV
jgi:hypothetical protein